MDGSLENENVQKSIVDHKMIELKGNHIPKGLVPLEILFNNHDIPVNPVMQSVNESVDNVNIGIEENPKYVKISKYLTVEQRNKYVKLMREFVNVFS